VLIVRDDVDARRPVPCVSRLHLHPDCDVVLAGPRAARVVSPGGVFRVAFAGRGELALETSRYFPEFGLALPNRALAFRAEAPGTTGFCVSDGDAPLDFDLDAGAHVGEARFRP
jgi:hypothetical protein